MMAFRAGWVVILAFAFSACEKKIDFKPRQSEASLVVDARIESGQAPVVVLSKSLGYFSKIDPEILSQSFVRNARVTLSNGEKTQVLKEYAVQDTSGYTIYYYSSDPAQGANAFKGEFNKTYNLTIESEGKTYTAVTHIPALQKKIDSLWWEPLTNPEDSSMVLVMARISDPPGLGNYTRYFTRSNQELFYPGLNSVSDDQIIDGKTYNIQIERGVDRNQDIDFENYSFFYRGDTVTVKFCNIDKATYDFWRTMEFSYASIGNPFSSPAKVSGNVKGALGYFGGYAVQYITLTIPR
jgi:hypothetical protein